MITCFATIFNCEKPSGGVKYHTFVKPSTMNDIIQVDSCRNSGCSVRIKMIIEASLGQNK